MCGLGTWIDFGGGTRATWDATLAGLEQRALGHRDCLMPMDDLSFLAGNVKEATKLITFRLAGNRSRGRAGEYVASQDLVESDAHLIALSTSEDPIWGAKGLKGVRGEDVRMIDVPACVSVMGDVFDGPAADRFVGRTVEERRAFVEALQSNSRSYQGKVFRAYLKKRFSDCEALATLSSYMEEFDVACPLPHQLPWLGRIRKLFAVCYASGVQARDYGLLPWTNDQILRAVGKCMRDAITRMVSKDIQTGHRNGDQDRSDEALLSDFQQRVSRASFVDLRKVSADGFKQALKKADGFLQRRPAGKRRCQRAAPSRVLFLNDL